MEKLQNFFHLALFDQEWALLLVCFDPLKFRSSPRLVLLVFGSSMRVEWFCMMYLWLDQLVLEFLLWFQWFTFVVCFIGYSFRVVVVFNVSAPFSCYSPRTSSVLMSLPTLVSAPVVPSD
jgi:hypothetical protein